MDKQYNLRSTKRDSIQIPVQVLCSDSEFSSKFGGLSNSKQQVATIQQVVNIQIHILLQVLTKRQLPIPLI